MSFTQIINVIHTWFQCHSHKISMLSTQDVNYKHKISMSSAQDKKCQPHKLSMWSTQDINVIQTKYQHYSYILSTHTNVIHTRYEFHSRKVSTDCMSYPASIQYINPICIKYLSSRGNQDIDLVKTRSSDCGEFWAEAQEPVLHVPWGLVVPPG